MKSRLLTAEQALRLLAETPARIQSATTGLSAAELRRRPSPDEWSVNDVLAHLRACADVRGGALAIVLAEDHPTIRTTNPRTYMETTDYPDLEFGPSFRAFAKQRKDLLAVLQSLPTEAWARSARITGAGKPLEYTVQYYADWLAVHERPHIKQIERVAATLHSAPSQF